MACQQRRFAATREVPAVRVRGPQRALREEQAWPFSGMADGSVVVQTPGNAGRAKGPWFKNSDRSGDSREIGDEPGNSEKVGKPRAALHDKAKRSPDYRFYCLYDKLYRKDVLWFAYRCCLLNDGKAGLDGQTFEDIESYGEMRWLDELVGKLTTNVSDRMVFPNRMCGAG